MTKRYDYTKYSSLGYDNIANTGKRVERCNNGFSKAIPLSATEHISTSSTIAPLESADAFRILLIHPGKRDDQIICTLLVRRVRSTESSTFPEPEPYDALSYNWGPQYGNKSIKIIAGDVPYSYHVGPNLDSALRQFRHETEDKFLWVDALCINQEDKEEKSTQIPLMRVIYNRAECVRVWLGVEADDSSTAMQFVERCLDPSAFDTFVTEPVASPQWAALSALVRRPWFSRRWVIQEIALAKHAIVHCGDYHIEWRAFAHVISMLARNQEKLQQLFRESRSFGNHPDFLGDLSELGAIRLAAYASKMCRKLEDGTTAERLFSLEALMSTLTAFEATEPHDILYAVLWLANDAHPVTKNAFNSTLPVPTSDNSSYYASSTMSHSPTALAFDPPSPIMMVPEGTEKFPDYDHAETDSVIDGFNPYEVVKRKRSQSDMSTGLGAELPNTQVKKLPRMTVTSADHEYETRANNTDPRIGPESPAIFLAPDAITPIGSRRTSIYSEGSQAPPPPPPPSSGMPSPRPPHRRLGRGPRLSIKRVSGDDNKKRIATDMFMEGLTAGRIVVDYERSVSEVCRDFLRFIFKQSSSIDMICKPWAPRDDTLPTWIPQVMGTAFSPTYNGIYRRVNADSLVDRIGHPASGQKLYWASRGSPAGCQVGGLDDKSLFVKGFVLDRIKERKGVAADGVIPADWMAATGWTDHDRPPPDLFWRSLVGNLDSSGQLAPDYWQMSCKNAFSRRPQGGALSTRDVLLDCPSTVAEFLKRVQSVVWSRRLGVLERLGDQSVAIMLAKAKKGDLVCILYGCSVPVILRQIIDGEPAAKRQRCPNPDCPWSKDHAKISETAVIHYEFIGPCYVHGMMNGEAFSVKRNHKDDKVFELR